MARVSGIIVAVGERVKPAVGERRTRKVLQAERAAVSRPGRRGWSRRSRTWSCSGVPSARRVTALGSSARAGEIPPGVPGAALRGIARGSGTTSPPQFVRRRRSPAGGHARRRDQGRGADRRRVPASWAAPSSISRTTRWRRSASSTRSRRVRNRTAARLPVERPTLSRFFQPAQRIVRTGQRDPPQRAQRAQRTTRNRSS
jgi:hypothetical protein